jgi:hypothetical protein
MTIFQPSMAAGRDKAKIVHDLTGVVYRCLMADMSAIEAFRQEARWLSAGAHLIRTALGCLGWLRRV